ncbi:uncharacterized protein ACHE_41198S [Aspergillus chevalieri]|uniref:Uncharacterized protein n=1 Tax=Aspergillus chevalieri TaxID=182096 RepID=A0A7R7VQ20_ASPCH|nr:uncharacterized protein ACHE_41198S [Aspergillus chevalieri]BCR88634.1 hypothetical protein ACHE_41198S [Aspergillus chevalieri]
MSPISVYPLTWNINKDRIVPGWTTFTPDNPNTFKGEREKKGHLSPFVINLGKDTLLSILHDHLLLRQPYGPTIHSTKYYNSYFSPRYNHAGQIDKRIE